jgi:hypothetical protein
MSFIGGLYIGASISGLGQLGVIIPIFTLIGVSVSMWKLFSDWRSTPKIEFGQIRKNIQNVYHVRVEKTRGKGKAKNCEGFITVEQTPIQDSASVWSFGAKRVVDIGGHLDLRLFRVEGEKILFPMWVEDGKLSENQYPLTDFNDKKPLVIIHSDNASGPNKFDKTIQQIIEEGDNNA